MEASNTGQNRPPTIKIPFTSKDVYEGENLLISIPITDPDGDDAFLVVSNLPGIPLYLPFSGSDPLIKGSNGINVNFETGVI